MKRFEAQAAYLSPGLLSRYVAAARRFRSREERFPAAVLLAFTASGAQGLQIRAADGEPTEILLYDEIGYWGVTAKDFVLALAAAGPGPIVLRINSPGGDTFDGLAIYNALKARTAPVTVVVDGIAASAASFIAMAGSKVTMPEQAMLMIHNCWGIVIGNRNDMTEMSQVMLKIDGLMAGIYAAKTGRAVTEMAAAMDAETYYTSTEAKAVGFCDEIMAAAALAARAQLSPASRRVGAKPAARLRRQRAEDDPAYPECDPGDPDPDNPNCAEFFDHVALRAQSLPPYDPDGDGDNDAAEALTLIGAARVLLDQAATALTGADADDGGDAGDDQAAPQMPMVPGAQRRRQPRAAATESEWVVGADRELPIDSADSWDGPAASGRMLDAAGFNGNSPDPAKAKRGFLVWDHHNPNLKGSYKLPFADIVGGELKAVKGGIDASASRLPQTDIPENVRAEARAVLDAYEKRMVDDTAGAAALAARRRRARLAIAEAA